MRIQASQLRYISKAQDAIRKYGDKLQSINYKVSLVQVLRETPI